MKSSWYDTKTLVSTSWNNHDLQLNLSHFTKELAKHGSDSSIFQGELGKTTGVSNEERVTAFI